MNKLSKCLETYVESTDSILRQLNGMEDCITSGVDKRIRCALEIGLESIENAIGMQLTSCIRERLAEEQDQDQ